MKRAKRVISAMLAGIMMIGMAGCGNGNLNHGGEGTNFPYTWKEERKGSILMTLDGSYGSSDYHWTAVSSDENVLKVTVAKKEKKGKISFRVTPLAEGPAQITFVREREVQDSLQTTESSQSVKEENVVTDGKSSSEGVGKLLDGKQEVDQQDNDIQQNALAEAPPPEDESMEESGENNGSGEGEESGEGVVSADEDYAAYVAKAFEEYQEKYRPKDTICEIEVQFNSVSTGKKGKYQANLVVARTKEHNGIMQNSGSTRDGVNDYDYTLWEDSSNRLQIRLPFLESEWNIDWMSTYTEPEDPGIAGIMVDIPDKEDGKYVILEIQDQGYFEGAKSFCIQGLYEGTATVEFSNPEKEKHLLIDLSISRNGEITVLSHKLSGPQG